MHMHVDHSLLVVLMKVVRGYVSLAEARLLGTHGRLANVRSNIASEPITTRAPSDTSANALSYQQYSQSLL